MVRHSMRQCQGCFMQHGAKGLPQVPGGVSGDAVDQVSFVRSSAAALSRALHTVSS